METCYLFRIKLGTMEKYQTKIQGLKLGEPNKKIHLDMLVSGPHGAVFSAIFKQ